MTPVELAYRKTAAAAGASGLEVLIALYDTLAGDLRRAAQAERSNDIEMRCREANHALLVIAHLEEWLSRGSGGELAQRLKAFYASARRRMLEAQARRSAEIFEDLMAAVLKVREQWQSLNSQPPSGPEILRPAQTPGYPGSSIPQRESSHLSWSA